MTTRDNTQDSSLMSSLNLSCDDVLLTNSKTYAKDKLKSRIFLGRYVERRLVKNNIGYRDIVLLSVAETDLKRDLLDVKQKLLYVVKKDHWIGVTDTVILGYTPPSICLWTEIDNQPFGIFWFQIRSILFREDEVIVKVKCIRHISEQFLELEPILTRTVKAETTDKIEMTTITLNESYANFIKTLQSVVTVGNIKEFLTFLFAFIIAIFTGSAAFINFLGNFILALVRELSGFTKNATPMFLGILEFCSKIVGGFYILLAMLFKPNQSIPRYRSPRRQPLTYYPKFDHNYYDDKNFD